MAKEDDVIEVGRDVEREYQQDEKPDFSGGAEEVIGMQELDPALDRKMHLVNNALDQIGWTNYHLKLFFLNGFGYGVDALQLSLQGIIAVQAVLEFKPSYDKGLTIALYMGMLLGALFWGFFADIIGRKIAFNISLFICSVFTIAAGGAPNWVGLGVLIAVAAFGAGGNLILDTAVFLEYLPSNKQWLLSLLPAWFGVGCTIAGLVAWGFMPNFSCADASDCTRANNSGWRYLMYTMGAFIAVLAVTRVTVIRLQETPNLFLTKKMGVTTILLWLSWSSIGLAYPLFNVFLPYYLASRGVEFGVTSTNITWRNYALVQICGIFGPILGAAMSNWKPLGRKYTMVIGALVTTAFFFAYSQVKSQEENLAYSCVISFTLEIYYGVLYGYTAESLISAHRGTANGIAVAFCRLAGAFSAVVATYADPSTTGPVFVCAALYGGLALFAVLFPFETYGKRAA
ncbi:major facilitator superfamily domain-containing protein [Trichoderma chlorosporum]